jgi:DNA-binding transcriptional regulator YhcF (GntR family)
MDIRISKASEIPLRRQLAEQFVLLIATEKLKPGDALPSVRELARRLKIHHNTVSEAYRDLVERQWLLRRRGSHLVVRPAEVPRPAREQDLDDLINAVIEVARESGYTLEALRERVRERLLAEPPDHILVVEEEPGLRELLAEEIRAALGCAVEGCSRSGLARQGERAMGALCVTPRYALGDVKPLLPKDRPPVPVKFCAADDHLERIRKLAEPSVVAVVSVSRAFLTTARSLLAPAIGRRHTLAEYLLPLRSPQVLRAADLVFGDSLAVRSLKLPRCVPYRLIAPASLEYLSNAFKSPRQA